MEEEEIVRGAELIGLVVRIVAACLVLGLAMCGIWWWKKAV
jgi:hypothetical protein